jgi:hypothetical protein
MSGLPAIIDFGFFYGRRLDELALGVHNLHALLGLALRGVSKIGAGALAFDFGAHHIEIHDSNEGDDSYSIRTRELLRRRVARGGGPSAST